MAHRDIKSLDEIPARTYRITFRGEELFVESKARDALARLPKDGDARGWRIVMEMDGKEPSVIYNGNDVWAEARGRSAA